MYLLPKNITISVKNPYSLVYYDISTIIETKKKF